MKLAGKIVLWVLTWPVFLGWLWPLLCFVTFGARDLRMADGVLMATWREWILEPRRFLAVVRWPFGRAFDLDGVEHRTWWKYSTTLAAGMVLQPDPDPVTLQHEGIHIRQCRVLVLLGLTLGLLVSADTGDWWWLPKLWAPGGLALYKLPGFLVPILEGNHVYRHAEHERSPYAQTAVQPNGKTWLENYMNNNQGW